MTGDVSDKTKQEAREGDMDALLSWTRARAMTRDAKQLIATASGKGGGKVWFDLALKVGSSRDKLFTPDPELRELWLKKAADCDDTFAIEYLGDDAVERRQYSLAAKYYTDGIKLGAGTAEIKYAYCMIFGLGVEKDVRGGIYRLQKLADDARPKAESVISSMTARTSLDMGTVDAVFCLSLLAMDNDAYTKMSNKDGSCNIADLEELFTGQRESEKYLKVSARPYYEPGAGTFTEPVWFTLHKEEVRKAAFQGDIAALIQWTRATPDYADRSSRFDAMFAKLSATSPDYIVESTCFDLGGELRDATGETAELRILWFKKSFDLGSAVSGDVLGGIYSERGDFKTALDTYRAAALKGSLPARVTAALYLYLGIGVTADRDAAWREITEIATTLNGPYRDVQQDAQKILKEHLVPSRYVIDWLGNDNWGRIKTADGIVSLDTLEKFAAALKG